MTVSINGTNGLTFSDSSTQNTAATGFGFKNRIINGAMMIDQRNAGASVTINNTGNNFAVDRFLATGQTADGVFTVQRSTVAPAGFTNSLLATVTTADTSIGASQIYVIAQRVEGFNVADLGWGSSNAQTVTLSFWVRSSLTGTFGGSITNETGYSYPFTYTINAANTFEQKSITITGATAGTWLTTNGNGITVSFALGTGTTFTGTSGAWSANIFYGATGQTQVIGTNGATFYITGVQLEKGSTATAYDYRPYGTELALCQRYYQKYTSMLVYGYGSSGSNLLNSYTFPVQFRATPTASYSSYSNSNMGNASTNSVDTQVFRVSGQITSTGVGYSTFVVEFTGAEL